MAWGHTNISSSLDFPGIFRTLEHKCVLDTPRGTGLGTHYRVEAPRSAGDGRSWKVDTHGIWPENAGILVEGNQDGGW